MKLKINDSRSTLFAIFLLALFICKTAVASDFPTEKTRLKIFDKIVSELERIDGEGLPPRTNRPEIWKETVGILREQVKTAHNPIEFGQVFRKLDATYPNLHAQLVLADHYDIAAGRVRPKIAVRFAAEVIERNQKVFKYKVNSIETEMVKSFKEVNRPAVGDEVLAINSKPIKAWSRENFIYCKFPIREQCEANFFDHFRKGFLSWDWRQPLKYTLQRNGRIWDIDVPFDIPSIGNSLSQSQPNKTAEPECPVEADRYDGFSPVYKGLNICAFESQKHPNVTVLRIASFRYRELPKESKIQSLKDEVEGFYITYWKTKAPTTNRLIIDVIDNGGGDTPIAWYQIFYQHPFQEQFVQFKKIQELEDERIRKDLFYEDNGKEIWFSELKKSGNYSKIKFGQFLPTIPQFCASEDKSCADGLFEARPNGFKGQIYLLVNEWCISTCTGFVWSIKNQLGKRAKLFGIPDSGDSAYARLFIDVFLDDTATDGFRMEISPRPGRTRQNLPDGAFLRQQITATRSTDSKGKVISARPTNVDIWVPYRYRHYEDSWEALVFKAALEDR